MTKLETAHEAAITAFDLISKLDDADVYRLFNRAMIAGETNLTTALQREASARYVLRGDSDMEFLANLSYPAPATDRN